MGILKQRWIVVAIIFVVLSFFAVYIYQGYSNKKINSFDECVKQNGGQVNLMYPPTCTTKDGRSFIKKDEAPPSEDFLKGWYWGSEDQKIPGTPDDWVYTDAGRSSCWHKVGIQCVPQAKNNLTAPFLCQSAGGTWLKDFNECESTALTESFCQKNNGKFSECESPCRHDPKADICQTVCMAVCKF